MYLFAFEAIQVHGIVICLFPWNCNFIVLPNIIWFFETYSLISVKMSSVLYIAINRITTVLYQYVFMVVHLRLL